MIYSVLAWLVALAHFGFIAFVLAGGLLIFWRPWTVWLHLPCAIYAITIMVFNWRCPLTDWEIALRRLAGETVEWQEFVQYYIWSHLGWTGKEWFIVPGLVAVLLICNWRPYHQLIGQGI